MLYENILKVSSPQELERLDTALKQEWRRRKVLFGGTSVNLHAMNDGDLELLTHELEYEKTRRIEIAKQAAERITDGLDNLDDEALADLKELLVKADEQRTRNRRQKAREIDKQLKSKGSERKKPCNPI